MAPDDRRKSGFFGLFHPFHPGHLPGLVLSFLAGFWRRVGRRHFERAQNADRGLSGPVGFGL